MLQDILNGQKNESEIFECLKDDQQIDRQVLDAMRTLLEGLSAGQKSHQDKLSAMLQAAISVYIPDSVINIGKYAFQDCESLTSVRIPSSIKSIEAFVFADCQLLANISVDDGAFDGCGHLMLYVSRGSFMEQYAKYNEIPYQLVRLAGF